jgi:hypothetical protein
MQTKIGPGWCRAVKKLTRKQSEHNLSLLSCRGFKMDLPLKDEIKLFETITLILLNQWRKKYYYFCTMDWSIALHNAGLSLIVTTQTGDPLWSLESYGCRQESVWMIEFLCQALGHRHSRPEGKLILAQIGVYSTFHRNGSSA